MKIVLFIPVYFLHKLDSLNRGYFLVDVQLIKLVKTLSIFVWNYKKKYRSKRANSGSQKKDI